MSAELTKLTEIVTALGTLSPDLASALRIPPGELLNVPDAVWAQLGALHRAGRTRSVL